MADVEVNNVRAVAGSHLIEAYDVALLVMACRETGPYFADWPLTIVSSSAVTF